MARLKKCCVCGRELVKKNELGLNKKLVDPETKNFYCLDCLAEYLEVDVEFLLEKIREFRDQGCVFFDGDER